MLLLLALAVEPCSVSAIRKLWTKQPGSKSRLFAFEKDGRIGFIDPTGKVVVKPTIVASIEDVGDFSDGLARVDHQGYIDETGRLAIKQVSAFEDDFSDGLAQVLVDDPNQEYANIGLVLDRTGRIVAKIPAFRTRDFSEGLAAFEAKGKPGIRPFLPPHLPYRDFPGLKGFLDPTGNIVIQPQFADVGPFVGGLARAVLDGYCHIETPDGGQEGTPTTGHPGDCGGAPADAVSPCKAGFINQQGRFVIEPRFEAAEDFREKFAAVRVGGVWGFIDTSGTVVIPPRFEQAKSFREGLAATKLNGKWGFIDTAGVLAIPARFEDVDSFSDSLAIVYEQGKASYIDRDGNTEIPGPFAEATPFVHGLAAVLLTQKHVAYIDHTGKIVFDYFRS
jgi:WG containing repeat